MSALWTLFWLLVVQPVTNSGVDSNTWVNYKQHWSCVVSMHIIACICNHKSMQAALCSGKYSVQVYVQVLGSRRGPLECIIGATAVGPTLHFGMDSGKLLPRAEVPFGSIDVLQVPES